MLPEVSAPASTPAALSARTWSRISAISGEMTTVTPSRHRAGSWKHSDLPPPVGMMASVLRPCQHGLDDLLLPRAEVGKAEDGMQKRRLAAVHGDGTSGVRRAAALFISTIRSA